jgi:hypothetical protein
MVLVKDSSQLINVTVIAQGHAIFSIGPVVNPTTVVYDGQATIDYTVQNTGGKDTLWGGLYDAPSPAGTLITGTSWGPISIDTNATYTPIQIVITHITTPIVNWELRIGHEE